MAEIIRGQRRGQVVDLTEWGDGWFLDDTGSIVNPLTLHLNHREWMRWVRNPCGMDRQYESNGDGTFKKRGT